MALKKDEKHVSMYLPKIKDLMKMKKTSNNYALMKNNLTSLFEFKQARASHSTKKKIKLFLKSKEYKEIRKLATQLVGDEFFSALSDKKNTFIIRSIANYKKQPTKDLIKKLEKTLNQGSSDNESIFEQTLVLIKSEMNKCITQLQKKHLIKERQQEIKKLVGALNAQKNLSGPENFALKNVYTVESKRHDEGINYLHKSLVLLDTDLEHQGAAPVAYYISSKKYTSKVDMSLGYYTTCDNKFMQRLVSDSDYKQLNGYANILTQTEENDDFVNPEDLIKLEKEYNDKQYAAVDAAIKKREAETKDWTSIENQAPLTTDFEH